MTQDIVTLSILYQSQTEKSYLGTTFMINLRISQVVRLRIKQRQKVNQVALHPQFIANGNSDFFSFNSTKLGY